ITDLPVTITDGTLSLTLGGSSGFSLLNYVQVTPATSSTLALSTTISGPGSVTSSPAGLACSSGTCTANFVSNSTVTLTATPSSGATFSGWSGACTGTSSSCAVTLTTAKSVTATFTTSPTEPPPTAATVQVNFQPATAAVPSGYQKDDGSAYSSSRGYGWTPALGNTRDRNTNPDQRLDTFVFVNANTTAAWRYDLPNGDYTVSVASGDPTATQGPQRLTIEGQVVFNNLTSAANSYLTITDLPVTITDGTLSLTLGGSSGFSLLNYVQVTPQTNN
ncbi:MAG: hypothetical protein ABFS23_14030, partial [Pseudomonadota bacterium]